MPGDGGDFLAGLRDPSVHERAYGGRLEPTEEAVDDYVAKVAGRFATGDALILAALERSGGAFLGSTMLFRFEPPATAEIGFWLAREARGRGLAEAAIGLTLRWGFEELGLQRIHGIARPSNRASARAMRRSGMAWESADAENVVYVATA